MAWEQVGWDDTSQCGRLSFSSSLITATAALLLTEQVAEVRGTVAKSCFSLQSVAMCRRRARLCHGDTLWSGRYLENVTTTKLLPYPHCPHLASTFCLHIKGHIQSTGILCIFQLLAQRSLQTLLIIPLHFARPLYIPEESRFQTRPLTSPLRK